MAKLRLNFMSEVLHRAVSLDVFLPADHMVLKDGLLPEKNRPYKTLYFLEGLMGNFSGPGDYSRLQGYAEDYNICVVVIGGENKWYQDSVLSGDNFMEMISRDVVNFTRRIFRLSHEREDTYIGGFSMGGHGAALIGLRYPEIFSKIICLSGAFHRDVFLESTEELTWDLQRRTEYQTLLGVKDMDEYPDSDNDYMKWAKRTAALDIRPEIFMCCGDKDDLLPIDEKFRQDMLNLGYGVAWRVYEGAGHSYYTCDLGVEDAFKWLRLENFVENYPYMTIQADIGVHNLNNWNTWYNLEKDASQGIKRT